ncbi:DUF92 domain-containing protein [Adhaeribacter aquaticus]|uniref:DUF92 domain-containing protein n=1 Tax=Adhaeribacter aquaticus TaxID=299567 RepID=UPI000427C42A|nr:DUF92 domain-containing protein [Adhaeribacter aquaticus]
MLLQFILVFLILGVGMYFSLRAQKLTEAGALTGGLLGLSLFLGAGFTGLGMLGAFFIIGTLASSWKFTYKASLGLAEENKGRRTAGQAFANAGVAGILGLGSWLFPDKANLLGVMLAGSFASATADTLASELGNLYGSRYYNILTFKPDKRGENGVISLEGTLAGLAGSIVIALLYGLGIAWDQNFFWIIIAGLVGNLADSVLGATLERKHIVGNNLVNFLNTLTGALVAGLLYAAF